MENGLAEAGTEDHRCTEVERRRIGQRPNLFGRQRHDGLADNLRELHSHGRVRRDFLVFDRRSEQGPEVLVHGPHRSRREIETGHERLNVGPP